MKGSFAPSDEEEEEEEIEEGEDGSEGNRGTGGRSDEEEDDEEGEDEYEKDGFIVDEDDDEEPDEEEAKQSSDEEAKARKKKKRRRSEENDELDEEDYELLREHNVFHRPKSSNKTKFRRLKKARKDDEKASVRGLSDDEEEEDDGYRRGRTAEEELKLSLFGDDEGAPPDDVREEEEPEEEEIIGEEDEMADFIVDEEEGEDDGQPFRRKKPKKKKAPRQAPGISSLALQEAQDIFGDVTALLDERRQRELDAQKAEMDLEEGDDRPGRSKMLEKQFEPSLLEEKFMTEKDDKIRDTDIPERLQALEEIFGLISSSSTLVKEAAWIYDRAFGSHEFLKPPEFESLSRISKDDVVRQISNALHLVHEDKLELPFIAMYRKQECLDLLHGLDDHYDDGHGDGREIIRYEALWAVQHWDKHWLLLQRRKIGLERAYEKRRELYPSGNAQHELLGRLLEALSDAESEQSIDDVDAKFNLHFPPEEIDVQPGQFKRPKRRSFYSACRKAGLAGLCVHFGLTAEKFGENVSAMYKRHDVQDHPSAPEEVAIRFLGAEFRDVSSVLKGSRHMAAVEISTEPSVREFVRNMYLEKAVLSTKPTAEGHTVIDAFHQFASVKWLLNKPIDRLKDAEWLLIQKAEEEKLLEVNIGLSNTDTTGNLIPEFETLYLSNGVDRIAHSWNLQRKQILRDALVSFLLPAMEKEVRMVLTAKGKQWVASQCSNEMWRRVSVGPYVDQSPEKPEAHFDNDGLAPRVMACCWSSGKPATTFVMLDASGDIVNILYTGYLTFRGDNPDQVERKKQDWARLLDFVMENQPHVVVIGGANLSCRRLQSEVLEVVWKIVEEHPRDLAEGLNTIGVVFGDESIPRLYENSRISEEQLVGHPGIVRRAVALGRYLQNPLAMVATLCGPGKEVLSLKLHSMQHFLPPDEVYEIVERILVTVTNQVGVDVNLAASHDWLFATLQFVSGLGPRKASYIQRAIQGAGRVSTRKELLTSLRLMGRKTFINSAGFLRVRGTGQASTGNQIMDPLDDTRIHPESYETAKVMAVDAYCEAQQVNREEMDEDLVELAIEHIKTTPGVLSTMDLEAYSSHLAEKGESSASLQTLYLLRRELERGYRELRNPYQPVSQDEEFHMLSGETEDTLSEGCIVHATVKKIQQNRAMCTLESGLLGFIQKEDISDDGIVDIAEKVSEGAIVTCRVKAINKAKYVVDLTCKGSSLRGENWPSRAPRDPYFQPNLSELQNENEKAKKKSEEDKRNAFKPRMIVHPQFQNVSLADATKALADRDVGEMIIRPSSKGPSHLSMTLKFYDGLYVHIDINEGEKDSRDITSFLRLGKTLTIGEETYEDLDEVVARYVDPLVSHLKDVLRYRKFKRGSKVEVDEALREEKTKNPMRIPYFFSICHEHPGAFRLSYIKNMHSVTHEYISVSPKGLKFRKREFDTPDKLVSYFQKHFKDPIPDVAPRRAMAAMVPPRSPAPNANDGSRNGSWPPSRPGEASTGWTSASGWDQGGGGTRGSGTWGRGAAASGTSDWDEQARRTPSSGGSWVPSRPASEGSSGWTGWAGPPAAGGYGVGRGVAGPVGGPNDWDRSQQGQRGEYKSGANGWGQDPGFSNGPLSDNTWGSRKPPESSGSGWDSGGSAWDQRPAKSPSTSAWDSQPESQAETKSSWEEAPGSHGNWDRQGTVRPAGGGWEQQSRGDPRRGGLSRDSGLPKQGGSGWDQPVTQTDDSLWDSSDPPSLGSGAPADNSSEPAAPGTSDSVDDEGRGSKPAYNSPTPKGYSVPWVWSGAT